MTAPTSLPYGMRDVKLTRYTDAAGSILDDSSIDLPNMQTFSFSESEEFTELRGDDSLVAIHGQGSQVEWEIEAGGVNLQVWEILTGGSVTEEGLTPNRIWRLRKKSHDGRPYFRAEGQAISDSGGDMHAIVYRAKANDTVEGEFADGEFFITSASGQGLPLLASDLLYDFVQNETETAIPLTPVPNPPAPPENLVAGTIAATTAEMSWDAVDAAESYNIEKSEDAGDTWIDGTPASVTAPTVMVEQTGLTTATAYQFRVRAVDGGIESDPSNVLSITTA